MDPYDEALAALTDEYLKTITGDVVGVAKTSECETFYFNSNIATKELLRRESL